MRGNFQDAFPGIKHGAIPVLCLVDSRFQFQLFLFLSLNFLIIPNDPGFYHMQTFLVNLELMLYFMRISFSLEFCFKLITVYFRQMQRLLNGLLDKIHCSVR